MDSNDKIHKINNTLPCGPVPATPDAAVAVRQPDGHGVRA